MRFDIPYGRVNISWDMSGNTTILEIGGYGKRVISWDTRQALASADQTTRLRGIIFLIEEAVKLMEEDGSVQEPPLTWDYGIHGDYHF